MFRAVVLGAAGGQAQGPRWCLRPSASVSQLPLGRAPSSQGAGSPAPSLALALAAQSSSHGLCPRGQAPVLALPLPLRSGLGICTDRWAGGVWPCGQAAPGPRPAPSAQREGAHRLGSGPPLRWRLHTTHCGASPFVPSSCQLCFSQKPQLHTPSGSRVKPAFLKRLLPRS